MGALFRNFYFLAGVALGVVVATLAATAFNNLFLIPQAKREARQSCVSDFEITAAKARAAELSRQVEAGRQAAEAFRMRAQQTQEHATAQRELLENRIADYEQRLAEVGRSCALSPADIDWLRQQ
jgi:hypothetical protein